MLLANGKLFTTKYRRRNLDTVRGLFRTEVTNTTRESLPENWAKHPEQMEFQLPNW